MLTRKISGLIIFSLFFLNNIYSQQFLDSYSDSAYTFHDSLCVTCNGSKWENPINATPFLGSYSRVFLLPNNQFDSDSAYYSQEFRFCNYGFNIPLTANIDSIRLYIFEGAYRGNAIIDSVVQLMKNHIAVGNNYAYPYPWLWNQNVYYPTGLYGTTWSPAEINDSGFGGVVRVKNISSDTVSARIIRSHIIVWYSTSSGIFSQSSENMPISVYPNPSNESFNVDFRGKNIKEIFVADLIGNIVYKKEVDLETSVEINNIEKGIYILYVIDKNGKSTSRKIISTK